MRSRIFPPARLFSSTVTKPNHDGRLRNEETITHLHKKHLHRSTPRTHRRRKALTFQMAIYRLWNEWIWRKMNCPNGDLVIPGPILHELSDNHGMQSQARTHTCHVIAVDLWQSPGWSGLSAQVMHLESFYPRLGLWLCTYVATIIFQSLLSVFANVLFPSMTAVVIKEQ